MKPGLRGAVAAAVAAAVWLGGAGTAHAAFGLTVAPDSPFTVGGGSGVIAVTDLSRDGRADLVLSESGSDAVRTFLGDGQGRFVADQVLHATTEIKVADVGDFNNDGAPDMVIADLGSSAPIVGPAGLHVLLNDGAGHFSATGPPIAVASPVASVTAADATGDGLLDIVTADDLDNTVTVRPGDGNGRFGAPKVSPATATRPGNFARRVLIADVTDDGRPDAVIFGRTDEDDSFVVVRRGDGPGEFTALLSTLGVNAADANAIALADLDGDGDLDIVALDTAFELIFVFRNDGTGNFTERPGPRQTVSSNGGAFALGDLDDDGLPDLVTGSNSSLQVLLGDGAGTFAPAPGSPFAVTDRVGSVGLGDVDADEDLDVITTHPAGSATVLLNTLKSPPPSPASTCAGEQATMLARPGVPSTGTAGADVIVGTTGADVIVAGGGDDLICARGGDDVVRAGAGDDLLSGDSGADLLAGYGGDDHLIGGSGPDRLFGNAGDDRLSGGDGDDVVTGGGGTDACGGGLGDNVIRSCE